MSEGRRARAGGWRARLAAFRPILGVALSFEAIFALYLYSNALKFVVPLPFPVDETLVFAALAALVGTFIVLRQGIYRPALSLLAVLLLFLTWVLLTWSWSPSRTLAKSYLTAYFSLDLFAVIAAGFVIAPSRERIVRFFLCVAFLAVVVAAYGFTVYLTYGSLRYYEGARVAGRPYLLWSYGAAYGGVVLFSIAIFSRLLSGKQLLSGGFLALCAGFLLVSGSRGALLGFGLAGLTLLLWSGRLWQGRRLQITTPQVIAILAFLVAVGYVAWMVAEGAATGSIGRFVKLFRQMEDEAVLLSANRFDYYAFAIDAWLRAPLFGNGVGSFSILYRSMEVAGTYPHNIFLEILAEYGVVGLALFLFVLAHVFGQVRRAGVLRDPVMLTLVGMFVVQFTRAMVAGTLSAQMGMFASLALLTAAPALARTAPGRAPREHAQMLPPGTSRPPFWIRWQV